MLGPGATGAELRALSRESMRSYARYWMEVFRLPVIPVERLIEQTVHDGHIEDALDYLKAGRGVVFALPHTGNWDQAGAWIIHQGAGSFTTVMERLKPESVYDRFVAFREGLGMEVLPASGGAVSRFGILAERLRAGKLVCLPADRDVTGAGIEVEFFGEKARMMGGSAALALRTGAALFPATLWYEGDRLGDPRGPRDPGARGGRQEAQGGVDDAGSRALLRGGHQAAPGGLAHAAAGLRRRPRPGTAGPGRRQGGRHRGGAAGRDGRERRGE